jgi:hypothetical protein
MVDVTNIPAPRVPFIDDRTGLMSREWYRFFLSLFNLTGAGTNPISLDDVQMGPDAHDYAGEFAQSAQQSQISSLMARYDDAQAAIAGAYMTPSAIPQNTINEQSNTVMAWLSVQ